MIDPAAIIAARRRQRSSANTKRGAHAQAVIAHLLIRRGLAMVEPIETGWRIHRGVRGQQVGASPLAKVAGDFRAIASGGISVLVEVKQRNDDRLSLCDFAPHQLQALTLHASLGGLSLVGHVHPGGADLLLWPIDCLRRGHPLIAGSPEHAAALWKG